MTTLEQLAVMAATRTDGCPRCLNRANQPIAGAVERDLSGVVCGYQCDACGHRWATSWGAWFAENSLAA